MTQFLFFDQWSGVLRTVVSGTAGYVALILILRISGKRTLSKLNAFDFVVTVALGSTLAAVLIDKSIPVAEGIVAFATLVGLQFVVTWLSVRFRWVHRAVTGEPTLLAHRGRVLHHELKRQRLTEPEMLAGARASGVSRVEDAECIILETDGSITAIGMSGTREAATGAITPAPEGGAASS